MGGKTGGRVRARGRGKRGRPTGKVERGFIWLYPVKMRKRRFRAFVKESGIETVK